MHALAILLLLIGGLLLYRWLQRQPPAVRTQAGIKIGLGVLGTFALLGVLTGRLNPMTLLVTAAAALPMLGRFLNAKKIDTGLIPLFL